VEKSKDEFAFSLSKLPPILATTASPRLNGPTPTIRTGVRSSFTPVKIPRI